MNRPMPMAQALFTSLHFTLALQRLEVLADAVGARHGGADEGAQADGLDALEAQVLVGGLVGNPCAQGTFSGAVWACLGPPASRSLN